MLNQELILKNNARLPNRIGKSALEEELGVKGLPDKEIFRLYQRWSEGNPGLLITGNVAIDRHAPTGARSVVLDEHQPLEPFKKWAQVAKSGGNMVLMQINQAGRQVPNIIARKPKAPSAIGVEVPGMRGIFNTPEALPHEEIIDLIDKFRITTQRAVEAGFDGVQIHAAHGYLISQFLSPKTNLRKDMWGGSMENRARFLFCVLESARAELPKGKTLAIKLNSADFQRGGFSEDDSLWVIKQLEDYGVDLLEISGGNYESPAMIGQAKTSTVEREAYFISFAERVRKMSSIPIMVTGGFRSKSAMEHALQSGALDIVGMGKPFVLYPDLPNQMIHGDLKEVEWPMKKINNIAIDSQSTMGWSWTQIARIANGKEPKPHLNTYWNLAVDLVRMLYNASSYKRWLRS